MVEIHVEVKTFKAHALETLVVKVVVADLLHLALEALEYLVPLHPEPSPRVVLGRC